MDTNLAMVIVVGMIVAGVTIVRVASAFSRRPPASAQQTAQDSLVDEINAIEEMSILDNDKVELIKLLILRKGGNPNDYVSVTSKQPDDEDDE